MPDNLLVCPKCKNDIEKRVSFYRCGACNIDYPILFGIADFRLRSDRYLTLEQERAKAGRLYEKSKHCSFEELLKFYYQITDDVPEELARRYRAYVLNAPVQARSTLAALSPEPNTALLDAGCGSGGLLRVAAKHFDRVIGVDIALRWLVIAQKRLEEAGVSCTLVCADVESLPFKEKSFNYVVASDLLEHVYDINSALKEITGQLQTGGKLWLSASNRYFIGPNSLTRIWGIGLLPKSLRAWLLLKIRGVDSLRFINLVSPLYIKSLLADGYGLLSAGPRHVEFDAGLNYPFQDRLLISIYCQLIKFAPLRFLLLLFGPAFEMIFIKTTDKKMGAK